MSATEYRYVAFRQEADGAISGTVIRYGDTAQFGRGWAERFERGALAWDDVIANIQHERAKPVARTGAGLSLEDSGDEVRATIRMADTSISRDARAMVDAGILRGLSMEFRVLAGGEDWDGGTRIIRQAKLTGIGIVDRPAYPDSVIADRMAQRFPAPMPPRRRYYY